LLEFKQGARRADSVPADPVEAQDEEQGEKQGQPFGQREGPAEDQNEEQRGRGKTKPSAPRPAFVDHGEEEEGRQEEGREIIPAKGQANERGHDEHEASRPQDVTEVAVAGVAKFEEHDCEPEEGQQEGKPGTSHGEEGAQDAVGGNRRGELDVPVETAQERHDPTRKNEEGDEQEQTCSHAKTSQEASAAVVERPPEQEEHEEAEDAQFERREDEQDASQFVLTGAQGQQCTDSRQKDEGQRPSRQDYRHAKNPQDGKEQRQEEEKVGQFPPEEAQGGKRGGNQGDLAEGHPQATCQGIVGNEGKGKIEEFGRERQPEDERVFIIGNDAAIIDDLCPLGSRVAVGGDIVGRGGVAVAQEGLCRQPGDEEICLAGMVASIEGIPPQHAAEDGDGEENKEDRGENVEGAGQGRQGSARSEE